MLAWLALVAALWSGNGDAPVAPIAAPIAAPNPVSQPTVSHPYLFTAIEIALVLAGGTIWYFRNGADERWSRGAEWRAWKRKMTAEDIVFDGDHYNTNAVGHPLGGTAYYQIARGNGLGPGPAFIASVLGSTFWEYFVEIPEHPSLNDLILTPAGGAVIGETTYQLGRYLARSGTSLGHCAGAFVFSPVASINDRPICRVHPGALLPWAKLGLSIGVNRAVFDGTFVREELAVAMGSEIVTQRAYQRPGSGSVPVAPGQWSSLFADGRFGGNHLDGFWFHAQTVWGGRYDRSYHVGGDETDVPLAAARSRGWGTMLGLGSSFDYRLRDLPRVHDRITSIGLGGPTFEFSARRSVLVRLSLSTQYAFAIVGSMAYRTQYPLVLGQTIKTPLRDSGYYYAHGLVYAATLNVDLGPIGFTGDARGGWYWSIDAADPNQSTIRSDLLLRDSRLYLTGAMWTRPVFGPLRFGGAVEYVRRASYMSDAGFIGTELNMLATTAFGF